VYAARNSTTAASRAVAAPIAAMTLGFRGLRYGPPGGRLTLPGLPLLRWLRRLWLRRGAVGAPWQPSSSSSSNGARIWRLSSITWARAAALAKRRSWTVSGGVAFWLIHRGLRLTFSKTMSPRHCLAVGHGSGTRGGVVWHAARAGDVHAGVAVDEIGNGETDLWAVEGYNPRRRCPVETLRLGRARHQRQAPWASADDLGDLTE
jgi:hypothetical protein